MTTSASSADGARRRCRSSMRSRPPERLAMLRILTGVFAVVYLLVRLPVFLQLGDRRSGFDGVGLARLLDRPVLGRRRRRRRRRDAARRGGVRARLAVPGQSARCSRWGCLRSARIEGRGGSSCTSRT